MSPEQRKKKSAEIWQTLSGVDVSEHVQKRAGLSFLSWAWAWGVLMEHYPQAAVTFERFEGRDVMTYADGTCSVHVSVEIDGITREMWLPVMDHRHKAVSQPTARQISDAKQRACCKAFALFGLGHYIYAGEDLPPAETPEAAPIKRSAPRGGGAPGPTSSSTRALEGMVQAHSSLGSLYGDDQLRHAIHASTQVVHDYLLSVWLAREQALGGGPDDRPDFSARDEQPGQVQDVASN